MKITIIDGLPFVSASLTYHNQSLLLESVLLDTGSAGTIFKIDTVLKIGLKAEPEDTLHRIRGVGGAEFVFTKHVEQLAIGDLLVEDFEIEIGAMDYGFGLNGIIGLDFLTKMGAVIDLAQLEVYRALQIK